MEKFLTYRISHENKLIINSYHGKVTMKDILSLSELFINDNEFNQEYNILNDFTSCVGVIFRIDVKDYIDFPN